MWVGVNNSRVEKDNQIPGAEGWGEGLMFAEAGRLGLVETVWHGMDTVVDTCTSVYETWLFPQFIRVLYPPCSPASAQKTKVTRSKFLSSPHPAAAIRDAIDAQISRVMVCSSRSHVDIPCVWARHIADPVSSTAG